MPRRPAQDTYTAVDAFVEATLFAAPDAALDDAATAAATAGMPEIQVTAPQARLLEIMPPGCRPAIHLSLTDDHPYAQAFVIIEALPL